MQHMFWIVALLRYLHETVFTVISHQTRSTTPKLCRATTRLPTPYASTKCFTSSNCAFVSSSTIGHKTVKLTIISQSPEAISNGVEFEVAITLQKSLSQNFWVRLLDRTLKKIREESQDHDPDRGGSHKATALLPIQIRRRKIAGAVRCPKPPTSHLFFLWNSIKKTFGSPNTLSKLSEWSSFLLFFASWCLLPYRCIRAVLFENIFLFIVRSWRLYEYQEFCKQRCFWDRSGTIDNKSYGRFGRRPIVLESMATSVGRICARCLPKVFAFSLCDWYR